MVATWYGDDSPHLSLQGCVSVAARGAPGVTGKAGENGQCSGCWAAAHPDKPWAPECGDTLKAVASFGLIYGGDQGESMKF